MNDFSAQKQFQTSDPATLLIPWHLRLEVYRHLTLCLSKQNSICPNSTPQIVAFLFFLIGYMAHPFPHGLQSPKVIVGPPLCFTPSVPTHSKSHWLRLQNTTQIRPLLTSPSGPSGSPFVSSLITNFLLHPQSTRRDLLSLSIRPH